MDSVCNGQRNSFELADKDGIVVRCHVNKRDISSLSTITSGSDSDFTRSQSDVLERRKKPDKLIDFNTFKGSFYKMEQARSIKPDTNIGNTNCIIFSILSI